jgi:hypothetical protein
MKLTQNPFSLYDFLGYFIPGSFVLYLLLLIQVNGDSHSFLGLIKKVKFDSPESYLPFTISSYILGHFIAFASSSTIERYGIWQYSYPSKFLLNMPYEGYFGFIGQKEFTKRQKVSTFLKRVVILILLLPITFFDFLIGRILGFNYLQNKTLDEPIRALVFHKTLATLKSLKADESIKYPINVVTQDFFTVLSHYVLENNKGHTAKIINYVSLYGFTRAISFSFVILFWYTLIQFIDKSISWFHILYCVLSISFISYISFLSFLKFYKRYSLEILMTIAVMPLNKTTVANKAM